MTVKRKFEISVIVGLIFSVLISITCFEADCKEIESGLLRLHIIANSDTDDDQNLKLKVRDRIIGISEELFKSAASKEDALLIADKKLGLFVNEAQKTVYENGYDYKVRGEICNCYFPTREYDTFTLPAGYYDAVRIIIGSGKGHNWWCVLFPRVCISAAAEFEGAISDKSEEIVTSPDKYRVKFAVVDLYNSVREKIKSVFFKKSSCK